MRTTPACLALLLAAAPAWAQPNPTADQIVHGLTPTGDQLAGATRGIRPAMPAAGLPPGGLREPGPAAPEAPAIGLTVAFASGSADMTPQAKATVDQLGRALTNPALAAYRFRIEGHTDTAGTPAANQALSERRAHIVAEYLQANFQIDAARLDPVGLGDKELLVPTPDQTPEPRNRRVKVINLGR